MPMLSENSRRLLLQIARQAIREATSAGKLSPLDLDNLPEELRSQGASFITITLHGQLRGCIGSLEARQPLALDVQEHAADAAMNDYRFAPLTEHEAESIHIEVSVLSTPMILPYTAPDELLARLRPEVDGVILSRGLRRATFLPQVWKSVPDPAAFLGMLCEKMGAESTLWREQHLEVRTYQVECFEEAD
jgi:AmmeMemoRadiSam system protein A